MPDEQDLDADEVRLEIRSAVERIRKRFAEVVQADAAAAEVEDSVEKAAEESA
jgi:hypothetical protein